MEYFMGEKNKNRKNEIFEMNMINNNVDTYLVTAMR
jgi:hypothetical protein